MNIRKQSADDHTVMGYADFCACAAARAMCGCSMHPCTCVCVNPSDTSDISAAIGQNAYSTSNSALRDETSFSAQAKMIH